MKINWGIRFQNKAFWVAIVPAVLLLVQAVAALVGFQINLDDVGARLLQVVEAVFVVLTILGVAVDPTTTGVSDSERALGYIVPAANINDAAEDAYAVGCDRL